MSIIVNRFVQLDTGTLPANWHGPKGTTLKLNARLIQMDSYAQHWRLYLYGHTGRARWFSIAFPRWRRELVR